MRTRKLTIKQRKEIFTALVETQEAKTMSPGDSIAHISEQFSIPEEQVKQIVEEGLDRDWFDELVEAA